jgi:hypothetical protein
LTFSCDTAYPRSSASRSAAATGKTSGVDIREMRATGAALFQMRDGEVMKLVMYADRDRALADLGLEA